MRHYVINFSLLQLEFQERINSLPDEEFYNGFVTWAALEDSLKGLKQQYENERLDRKSAPIEAGSTTQKAVAEAANQTDMVCVIYIL